MVDFMLFCGAIILGCTAFIMALGTIFIIGTIISTFLKGR